jgi:hypothetical protein
LVAGLFKVVSGAELVVAGELCAGKSGLAFELDFVEAKDGAVCYADEERSCGYIEFAGCERWALRYGMERVNEEAFSAQVGPAAGPRVEAPEAVIGLLGGVLRG